VAVAVDKVAVLLDYPHQAALVAGVVLHQLT
jgi:hypothetical protein